MLQEFGDAVAQCVQHCADQRPPAEHLLKHRFFKLASRHPEHIIRHLWKQVPEQSEAPARPLTDSEAGLSTEHRRICMPGMALTGESVQVQLGRQSAALLMNEVNYAQ